MTRWSASGLTGRRCAPAGRCCALVLAALAATLPAGCPQPETLGDPNDRPSGPTGLPTWTGGSEPTAVAGISVEADGGAAGSGSGGSADTGPTANGPTPPDVNQPAAMQAAAFFEYYPTDSAAPASAAGLSGDGAVLVGQMAGTTGSIDAFRWQPGGPALPLIVPRQLRSYASACGASATAAIVVGAVRLEGVIQPARWTREGQLALLGDLGGPDARGAAADVSANGTVIVGYASSPDGPEAFRWTGADGMVGLGDLPGGSFYSVATAVSADGTVVVGQSHSALGYEAFLWSEATGMIGLGLLTNGTHSRATDVSGDGSVVVGFADTTDGLVAFRWTEDEGMTPLGDLPGGEVYSIAAGVARDGSVVIGSSLAEDGPEAFVWTARDGMQPLADVLEREGGFNLAGWRLLSADAISDDARTLAGVAQDPDGRHVLWVAHLP